MHLYEILQYIKLIVFIFNIRNLELSLYIMNLFLFLAAGESLMIIHSWTSEMCEFLFKDIQLCQPINCPQPHPTPLYGEGIEYRLSYPIPFV